MAKLEWSDLYSVGNAEIDTQHQRLFEITNRLQDAYDEMKSHDVVGKIFEELLDDTQTHFSAEEALMEERGYPHYYQHCEQHRNLIELLLGYKKYFDDRQPGVVERLLSFVQTWFKGHILGEDKRYKDYLKD